MLIFTAACLLTLFSQEEGLFHWLNRWYSYSMLYIHNDLLSDAAFTLHWRFAVSLFPGPCPVNHNAVLPPVTSTSLIHTHLAPNIIQFSSGLHCWRQWITKALIHRMLFSYDPDLGFGLGKGPWFKNTVNPVPNSVSPVCPSAEKCIFCPLAMVKKPLEEGYVVMFLQVRCELLQIAWTCTD